MSIIGVIETCAVMGFEPAMVKFVAQYRAQGNTYRARSVIDFGLKISTIFSFILGFGIFLIAEPAAKIIFKKK